MEGDSEWVEVSSAGRISPRSGFEPARHFAEVSRCAYAMFMQELLACQAEDSDRRNVAVLQRRNGSPCPPARLGCRAARTNIRLIRALPARGRASAR